MDYIEEIVSDYTPVCHCDKSLSLKTLKELNDMADFLVKITGAKKRPALRAVFNFYGKQTGLDVSDLLALINPDEDWLTKEVEESLAAAF